MKIFAFMYNPMMEESAYATISLHETRKGAEEAMGLHKDKEIKKWEAFHKHQREKFGDKYEIMKTGEFGLFEDWCVEEIEVLK